jgi:hypothetical protein
MTFVYSPADNSLRIKPPIKDGSISVLISDVHGQDFAYAFTIRKPAH